MNASGKGNQETVNTIVDWIEYSRTKIGLLEFIFSELPKLCTWGKLLHFMTSEIIPAEMEVGSKTEIGGLFIYQYFLCEMMYDADPFEFKIFVRVRIVSEPDGSIVVYADGYSITELQRYKLQYLDLKTIDFTPVKQS